MSSIEFRPTCSYVNTVGRKLISPPLSSGVPWNHLDRSASLFLLPREGGALWIRGWVQNIQRPQQASEIIAIFRTATRVRCRLCHVGFARRDPGVPFAIMPPSSATSLRPGSESLISHLSSWRGLLVLEGDVGVEGEVDGVVGAADTRG